jgi:8-oxo-dGTP pyrophosphatase MutT (NUDIX family)
MSRAVAAPWQQAAVLVPLCRRPSGVRSVLLVRRREGLRTHPGQIAFPGGRHDPERDDGLLATALREAAEEVGLEPSHVEIVGVLAERRTLTSSFRVAPFVGLVGEPPGVAPRSEEVEEIFTAPLDAFRDPERRRPHEWKYRGGVLTVPSVHVEGRVVWGLTLDIVDDLLREIDRLLHA